MITDTAFFLLCLFCFRFQVSWALFFFFCSLSFRWPCCRVGTRNTCTRGILWGALEMNAVVSRDDGDDAVMAHRRGSLVAFRYSTAL